VRGQHHAQAAFNPGKDAVPIVQEAGLAPGPVWTVSENLAPTGFDPQTVQPVASRYGLDIYVYIHIYLFIPYIYKVIYNFKLSINKIFDNTVHVQYL